MPGRMIHMMRRIRCASPPRRHILPDKALCALALNGDWARCRWLGSAGLSSGREAASGLAWRSTAVSSTPITPSSSGSESGRLSSSGRTLRCRGRITRPPSSRPIFRTCSSRPATRSPTCSSSPSSWSAGASPRNMAPEPSPDWTTTRPGAWPRRWQGSTTTAPTTRRSPRRRARLSRTSRTRPTRKRMPLTHGFFGDRRDRKPPRRAAPPRETGPGRGLSESRFRAPFVAETGVSLRAYILWARLNRALDLGFGGTSWTEAAHAANFADFAHLTRTCRRMFGLVLDVDAT